MKKFLILAAIALMAATSQAQIVSSNSTKITTTPVQKVVKESMDYNRISFGFANMSFHGDLDDPIDILPGFSFGYLHGSNLMKQLPLYLEYGGEIVFNKNDYDKSLTFDIPISLTYKQTFGKGFYVAPYAGIAFRIGMLGKSEYDDYYDDYEEIDWFSDMECNRFQFGGQIGVNLGYKAFNFGIGYRMFTPWFKEEGYKIKTHSFSATVGVNF